MTVNDSEQLEILDHHCFGHGSSIIVTTRDKQVMFNDGADHAIYEVEGLNVDEALELFRSNTSKGTNSTTSGRDYQEEQLERALVHYADGIPFFEM